MVALLSDLLGTPISEWELKFRIHATQKMSLREIENTDVINVLEKGNIIESYEDDYPFPSVLLNGFSKTEKYLHIVVGIDFQSKCLYVITVYKPDVKKWTNNFNERKNK